MEPSTEKVFCVYALLDEHVRYVGKTNAPRVRLWHHLTAAGKSHKSSWIKALRRAGKRPRLEVLEEKLGEVEAFDKEKFYIEYFNYLGADLTNMTDGGDGISGHRHNAETRKRMAASHTGLKRSEEAKANMRAAQALVWKTRSRVGHHHNEVSKRKLSESHCKLHSIPVNQYDLNGNFIATYPAIQVAAKTLGKKIACSISLCCKGKHETSAGFIWKFAEK